MTQLGLRLKERGLDAVEHSNETWLDDMRTYLKKLSLSRGPFGAVSADDARSFAQWTDNHPEHPNAYGALFRESCWKCVGRMKSKHPSNHGREIKLWGYVG